MSDPGYILRDKNVRLTEAASWRVYLTEIQADTTAEFEAWLIEPKNATAWAQISGPWDYVGEQANEPALVAARQAALGYARRASALRERPRRWNTITRAVAAIVVIALGLSGAIWWHNWPDDYSTSLGERRVVTLVDGSRISLDSGSEVTVRYTQNARELHLLHGQARFDVAHDVERPFSVVAGDQKVIATGTAFNIDLSGKKVIVTLIQGHVVVLNEHAQAQALAAPDAPSPKHRAVELEAGEQLASLPDKPPIIAEANIQRVTAWTQGQLIFDNETLATVVARVNRYTSTPIVIADPKVGAMRISGVFNTGDVSGFVDIVTRYLRVTATESSSGQVELYAKG